MLSPSMLAYAAGDRRDGMADAANEQRKERMKTANPQPAFRRRRGRKKPPQPRTLLTLSTALPVESAGFLLLALCCVFDIARVSWLHYAASR